jgi:hypothetical protein
MEKWKQLNNHLLVPQHLKKVILTIKIPYCNNPTFRTPFLQHMNHPITIFDNHLLQHPKKPIAIWRNGKKTYKTARGWIRGVGCSSPWAITFELARGRREYDPRPRWNPRHRHVPQI